MLFLSKDGSLAIPLVQGLLKYWPYGNNFKENFFLTELLEVLEVIDLPKLEPLIEKLFKRLIKCITGKNAAVTDKTLQYLENENFTTILKHYKKTVFPWLVPVINLIVNKHWHKIISESLQATLQILRDMDSVIFDEAMDKPNVKFLYLFEDGEDFQKHRKEAESQWEQLEKKARAKNPTLPAVKVPYQDYHVVGKNNGLDNGHIYYV